MRILSLLVLVSTLDAAAATGKVTRLSTGSAQKQQNMPAVSGTNVVWTDSSVSAAGASNFDIYADDLTGVVPLKNLTGTPDQQEFLEDIDGTNVVYTRTSSLSPGDIVVYDLSTDNVSTVAGSTATIHFEQPSLRGNWITFLRVGAQIDVYLYDLASGNGGLITGDAAVQARPRVGGGSVVFEDYTNGASDGDILGYTIPSGPPFVIANGPANQITPDVDGNTVVYIQTVSGHDQLFAYDLTNRTNRQLTSSISAKMLPRISGNRIVWSDDRNGNLDLYLYDLSTSKEEPLVTGLGDQFLSDIDGNRVVFTDNAAGFEQVYLFTFDGVVTPPPTLPPGCDPAKTNAVGASVSMSRTGNRPVYAHGKFNADAGKTYWVCVDNGLADGSQRTSQFEFESDHRMVLTPSDFHPVANPPRHVAAKLPTDAQCHGRHAVHHDGHDGDDDDDHSCGCSGASEQEWEASLFGCNGPSHVTVTIRVSK